VLSTSSFSFSVSHCGGCSLTATTAPSLTPACPKWIPYKVPVSPGFHHHPKVFLVFLFPTVVKGLSRVSGVPTFLADAASGFFFCFGGGRPLHNAQFLIFSSGGPYPSTSSSSSFSATRWTSWLLASRDPFRWSF
jgi:hypothetical protein